MSTIGVRGPKIIPRQCHNPIIEVCEKCYLGSEKNNQFHEGGETRLTKACTLRYWVAPKILTLLPLRPVLHPLVYSRPQS